MLKIQPSTEIKHCVILVHGIRTFAHWMPAAKEFLSRHGLVAEATSYGKFGLIKFLLPFSYFRRKVQNIILDDIKSAIAMHKPDKVSIIAHSFGTYIAANIIKENPDIKWNKIIFCGSVLKDSFPVHSIVERISPPILNEIGENDFWPAIAEAITWGYGSIGTHGFNKPGVESRWHPQFKHSDFFSENYIAENWVPFLNSGHFEHKLPPKKIPFIIKLISGLKYFRIFMFFIFLLYFYIFFIKNESSLLKNISSEPYILEGGFSVTYYEAGKNVTEIWATIYLI